MSSGNNNSEISIKNVSFSYDNSQKKIIDGLNINIKKGEFVGILGANGSGKSTLLKMILKYFPIKTGNIEISDKNISLYSPKEMAKIISFVPQKSALNMPISVIEMVYMGRTPHIKNKWIGFDKEDERKVNEIFSVFCWQGHWCRKRGLFYWMSRLLHWI